MMENLLRQIGGLELLLLFPVQATPELGHLSGLDRALWRAEVLLEINEGVLLVRHVILL